MYHNHLDIDMISTLACGLGLDGHPATLVAAWLARQLQLLLPFMLRHAAFMFCVSNMTRHKRAQL